MFLVLLGLVHLHQRVDAIELPVVGETLLELGVNLRLDYNAFYSCFLQLFWLRMGVIVPLIMWVHRIFEGLLLGNLVRAEFGQVLLTSYFGVDVFLQVEKLSIGLGISLVFAHQSIFNLHLVYFIQRLRKLIALGIFFHRHLRDELVSDFE